MGFYIAQKFLVISSIISFTFNVVYLPSVFQVVSTKLLIRYCLISLTLPVDLCLYMAFLIVWRIVCSRTSPGEL